MNICIFGAGNYGYEAFKLISGRVDSGRIFFCDNYTKEKISLNGIRIVKFDELKEKAASEDIAVVIAVAQYQAIYEQCTKARLKVYGIYDNCKGSIIPYAQVQLHRDKKRTESSFLIKYSRYLILKNIYRTHYKKSCLILYITEPFVTNNKMYTHTNQPLAKVIAKVFHDRGYNVDVARFDTKRNINMSKYDVVFGFGHQFDNALKISGETSLKTIAFLTGASIYYSNLAELNRVKAFEERNHTRLKLRRQCNLWGGLTDLNLLQNAAVAVCIGNQWTCKTNENMFRLLYKITATGFTNVKLKNIQRNIQHAKKNFLWFAGRGALHKGLDLCIEAFRKLPDLDLYIAGTLDDDFYEFYKEDLGAENIHFLGFIQVNSYQYECLCAKCLFSILPSCSEGSASSVLTNMFSGMIPVVTEQAGVDIGDFGFQIEDIEVDAIVNLVRKLSMLSNDELKEREQKAYKWAVRNHTLQSFETELNHILGQVLIGTDGENHINTVQ